MVEKLSILIGGDTVPTISNENDLINGQGARVFNSIRNVFYGSDFVVVNLECPLTESGEEITKVGPCLKARPETINGMIDAGINIFSLSNNHIMDFGETGLEGTINLLHKKELRFLGAGQNISEAKKPLSVEKKGIKVTFISVAEHEFSIASGDGPGANPVDPIGTMTDIRLAAKANDAVVVLYHGGIEHYQLPSPGLQYICRQMIEAGATVVICQHSHCIGAYENFENGHILYGQGNLLFDYKNDELWRTGLLTNLTIDREGAQIEFLPVVKRGAGVDLADPDEAASILGSFQKRNQILEDEDLLKSHWDDFCESRKFFYLQSFLGFSDFFRKVDNRLGNWLTRILLGKNYQTLLKDFINCESHREVIQTILN